MTKFNCDCNSLQKDGKSEWIWGVAIPIICAYQVLNGVGILNIYRFCRLNGFTRSLFAIYFFSIIEQIAISVWIGTVQIPTMYNYMPYIIYLYSKLCLGISYQVSVFELKFIIEHYFKGTDQTAYAKKRKIMYYIMWVWRFGIAIFFICDIYFNYWRYVFNSSIPES